jgi:hypothetical protein
LSDEHLGLDLGFCGVGYDDVVMTMMSSESVR